MTYGVIFDMDGVLVDSYQPHFESWKRSAAQRGLAMTEQQFATTFGRTSREIVQHLWPEYMKDPKQVTEWDRQKEQAYRDILAENFPEMDGADELLADLHEAGFKLAIGSSGPPENIEAVVNLMKNGKLFDTRVTGLDVKHGKPHPEVFQKAAAKLGLEPKNCVVVEDAPVGVAAGKAAGSTVIAITGTAPSEKLAQADHIVDSLRQITPQLIRELIRKNERCE